MKYLFIPFLTPFLVKAQTEAQISEALGFARVIFAADEETLPTMIRFGFHSCHGTAGCNGCLNMDNSDNNGLGVLYDSLNDYYDQLTDSSNFTRADFWNVFFVEALNQVTTGGYTHTVGRTDCATSPHEADIWEYPNPRLGWDHVLDQFGPNSEYGLPNEDAFVLIAGGHSLGRARLENSGFRGPWDDSEQTADEDFFEDMVGDSYVSQQNPSGGEYQWNQGGGGGGGGGGGNEFALNTDMSLVKTFTFDSSTGEVTDTCAVDSQTCANNPATESIVAEYQAGTRNIMSDFGRVYHDVLLTKGYAASDITEINGSRLMSVCIGLMLGVFLLF